MSNNFSEQKYAVLRKNQVGLIFAQLALSLICATYFFFAPKIIDSLQQQILLVGLSISALLFWLIPSIRSLSNRFEITSNRVISKSGLFGTRVNEIAWGEVTGVSMSRGFFAWLNRSGDIHLHREFGVDFVLRSVPRVKRLSREIELFLAKRNGVGQ